jgi:hypothetical protein
MIRCAEAAHLYLMHVDPQGKEREVSLGSARVRVDAPAVTAVRERAHQLPLMLVVLPGTSQFDCRRSAELADGRCKGPVEWNLAQMGLYRAERPSMRTECLHEGGRPPRQVLERYDDLHYLQRLCDRAKRISDSRTVVGRV